ncbi:hypothetical protein CEXT_199131 [Caerostris extrusa]|uniref:Secreted protein n=1 Tax=Caerostris extrusa TaxID=172846 RepID=A0AAV4WT54_CAEEX|nr:hypothetical protein CEXT_199131 [Caerostris extrusa]
MKKLSLLLGPFSVDTFICIPTRFSEEQGCSVGTQLRRRHDTKSSTLTETPCKHKRGVSTLPLHTGGAAGATFSHPLSLGGNS